MYAVPEIIINGLNYRKEDILQGVHDHCQDTYVHEIIGFCKAWLGGDDSFSIHTSGSTGDPKQIRLLRSQMIASAWQTIDFFELESHDLLLMCLNPMFIGGKMMLVRAFVRDMKIYAVTPSANPLEKLRPEERFHFTAFSPQQLYHVLTGSGKGIQILENMKAVIVGGAPVDASLREMVQYLKVPVYSTYGMTETVSHVALQRLNGPEQTDYYFGLGDVQFGTEADGRLTICGSVTADQLLVTNDLAELLSERRFRWIGRADNVINSGGMKFGIDELEKKIGDFLAGHRMSCRFIVFPLADRVLGQKICLVIESTVPIRDRVKEMLLQTPWKYEKPKEVYSIGKFAETQSGKIDRRKTIELIQQF